MFTKLIRHEWRATWGLLGLLCAIIIGSGTAIGGVGLYLSGQVGPQNAAAETICLILVMVCVLAIAVCGAGGVFYLIWRFYHRCFTDVGYLTFTLPVSRHQILLSSVVNSIWGSIVIFLAGCASVFISFGLLFGMLVLRERESIVWADAIYGFETVWEELVSSLQQNWENLLLLLAGGAISWISSLLLIMLAVTIGCLLAKKHKVLMGVAAYYGIQFFLGLVPLLIAANGRDAFGLFGGMTQIDFADFMGYSILRGLAAGLLYYFSMYFLMKRKLNLN